MALRLVIGCSCHLFCEGLKRLVENEQDFRVVGMFDGSSGNPPDLNEIARLNPDVILADFNADFNVLLRPREEEWFSRKLKIILLGDRSLRLIADRQLKDLILKGVVGILPPSADSVLLKKALKAVVSGELWLDRHTLMKIIASMRRNETHVSLAKREREIVSHICQGYRNKEIAAKMHISEQTVKSHCNRIYKKLGVSDRLQLALYSYKIWPHDTDVGRKN